MSRLGQVLVLFTAVFLAANASAKEVKTVTGQTLKATEPEATIAYRINVPNLLPKVNNVKEQILNNGQQVNERYYVNNAIVATASHPTYGQYGVASVSPYRNKDDFLDALGGNKFFKSRLSNPTVTEFSFAGDFGVHAEQGSCYWIRLAKDIGTGGSSRGGINLLVNIVGCGVLKYQPVDMLKKLRRATNADLDEYNARRRP